jgi:hypothetical protein
MMIIRRSPSLAAGSRFAPGDYSHASTLFNRAQTLRAKGPMLVVRFHGD